MSLFFFACEAKNSIDNIGRHANVKSNQYRSLEYVVFSKVYRTSSCPSCIYAEVSASLTKQKTPKIIEPICISAAITFLVCFLFGSHSEKNGKQSERTTFKSLTLSKIEVVQNRINDTIYQSHDLWEEVNNPSIDVNESSFTNSCQKDNQNNEYSITFTLCDLPDLESSIPPKSLFSNTDWY